jgi:hypothetical protein
LDFEVRFRDKPVNLWLRFRPERDALSTAAGYRDILAQHCLHFLLKKLPARLVLDGLLLF